LKEAEAEIAAGNCTTYNPDSFVEEMVAAYRAAKAKKSA
jgi:NADH:ubiquinone oxidoreductase subunit H